MISVGLTGGTGFIGQYFVKQYADTYKIIVAAKRDNFESFYHHENIVYEKTDYTISSFMKVFKDCSAIVHLGFKRPTKENESSIVNYFDSIVVSESLFNACYRLHITNITNISTRSVYSTNQNGKHKESELTAPFSSYGISKLCVENIANIFNEKYEMKIKTLRLSQVLGLGERKSVQTEFLNRSIKKDSLYVYGDGKSKIEYIYVKDACRSISEAIHHKDLVGIFNISSGESISILDLARLFCKVFDNPAKIIKLKNESECVFFQELDNSKAVSDLGFIPKYNIEDSLYDMKSLYYQDNTE